MAEAPQSEDGVVLQVKFLRLADEAAQHRESVWRLVDEQLFPVETHRRLTANGLRCGVTSSPLAALWGAEFVGEEPSLQGIVEGDSGDDYEVFARGHQLQMRPGKSKKVAATSVRPGSSPVLYHDGQHIRGDSFEEAQGFMELTVHPATDGRIRLLVTPRIEHGAVHQDWIGTEGSLVLMPGRDSQDYGDLQVEATLSAGQTLIVTNGPAKGVGRFFFAGSEPTRAVMLIHLAKSEYDNLFSPESEQTPLTTQVD